ncbi:MarR family winged helix-turn-helix transcriptional regulator [Ktedonospora formicarum]|uniref:MarR family transcriptional regulator n=1 Tax=Ktedonospora formicarum TaxID=2778364 RepID=A0A8J3I3D3_9CHLR|nr:MarR family winged helix-turn-helix transcriptional regulator [Ktedonospora formicarum]GHO48036.1 MarR family transcriptional regulator [Ktedonospora formicarum]
MKELIDTSAANICACANLRRTDLVVSQFYDGMLAPSGLSALQFSILCAIDTFDSITTNRLIKIIGMDRGTLSRHLKVLANEDFISFEAGNDLYTMPLSMTPEGLLVLEDAWPLWQKAQNYIENNFGLSRFETLLNELQAVRTVLTSAL